MSESTQQEKEQKTEDECPACRHWAIQEIFFSIIAQATGFFSVVIAGFNAFLYLYAWKHNYQISDPRHDAWLLYIGFLAIPSVILRVVGLPSFRGIIDGKVHVHGAIQLALQVKGVLQLFDLGGGTIIQKPLGGRIRKVQILGGGPVALGWHIERTGIYTKDFILRDKQGECVGISRRGPDDRLSAFFWLERESMKSAIDYFATFRGNAIAFEREATRLRGELEAKEKLLTEERERPAKAVACIMDLRVAVEALRQRIEESGKTRPKHQCQLAQPIKDRLTTISLAIPRDLCGTPLWESDEMKAQVAGWLDRLPKLLESKPSTTSSPVS